MIDLQQLTSSTSHFGMLALALAFLAGIVASVGPTSYALVPAIVGFGVGVAGRRRLVFTRAALAAVGIVLVSAMVGAAAGSVGGIAVQWFGSHIVLLYAIGAATFAFVGLRFLGVVRLSAPGIVIPQASVSPGASWDAFALGCALAVAACPACTPILLAVVLGAVAIGHPVAGAVLLAAFGVGRTLPVAALAVSAAAFGKLRILRRFVGGFERVGGVLLLLSAIYWSYEAFATWAAFHAGSTNPMTGMPGM